MSFSEGRWAGGWSEVGKTPHLRGHQGKTGQRTTVFQYEQGENVPGGGWGPEGPEEEFQQMGSEKKSSGPQERVTSASPGPDANRDNDLMRLVLSLGQRVFGRLRV